MTSQWMWLAQSVTPASQAGSDIITYVLGFGPLGIGVILFVARVIVPKSAVDDARKDLLKENERLIEERDEALKSAQALVPLLTSFVATSQSLIPLLQELVRKRTE